MTCAAGLIALAFAVPAAAQTGPVLIFVTVPADAALEIDGTAVRQTGPVRRLITPPLEAGKTYSYALKATFAQAGRTVVVEKTLVVEPGRDWEIDLTKADTPAPTPAPPATPKKEPAKEAVKPEALTATPRPKAEREPLRVPPRPFDDRERLTAAAARLRRPRGVDRDAAAPGRARTPRRRAARPAGPPAPGRAATAGRRPPAAGPEDRRTEGGRGQDADPMRRSWPRRTRSSSRC